MPPTEAAADGGAQRLPTALELLGDLVGAISSARVPAGRDAKKALEVAVNDRRR